MRNFLQELKRRNVVRVGIAYLVFAWVLLQVGALIFEFLGVPDWSGRMLFAFLLLGFPLALFFAWAFELTPEGLKKESEVDRSQSITAKTRRKLDFTIIGVLAVAVGLLLADKFLLQPEQIESTATSAAQNAATMVAPASIAVLPFANRSRQDDDLFFTDGIHDDLLTQLAKIKDLRVISRTSVMQYRDTEKAIPLIAEDLGVARILEGGVQRAGSRIRINAQLIDVATDEHLWAETFDREMTIDNLFDIQSEITRQIVTAIKGQLTPAEQRILDDKPTNSLGAWEAYSKARELVRGSGFNFDTYQTVEPLLEEAVRLDPDFYSAHAMLVDIHGLAYWIGYDQSEARRQAASDALARAAAIAPDSPEVLTAQGLYLYRLERDYAGALQAQLRALQAKPGDADILHRMGLAQRRLGQWEESVESTTRAYEADPSNVMTISTTIESLTRMGLANRVRELLLAARKRYPEDSDLSAAAVDLAIWADGDVAKARRLHASMVPNVGVAYFFSTIDLAWVERDPDSVITAWQRPEIVAYATADNAFIGQRELELAWAYRIKGDEQQASTLLQDAAELLAESHLLEHGTTRAYQQTNLARVLALQGDFERAANVARDAMLAYPISIDYAEGPYVHTNAWQALAIAGRRDEAVANIAELLDMPAGFKPWYLYLDPRWDFFRDDDRFNKLIEPDNLDESPAG